MAGNNMFGDMAKLRRREQTQTEAAVTGKPAPKATGRPKKRLDGTTITLGISKADKEKVKAYALAHGTTVTDMLHAWIEGLT